MKEVEEFTISAFIQKTQSDGQQMRSKICFKISTNTWFLNYAYRQRERDV